MSADRLGLRHAARPKAGHSRAGDRRPLSKTGRPKTSMLQVTPRPANPACTPSVTDNRQPLHEASPDRLIPTVGDKSPPKGRLALYKVELSIHHTRTSFDSSTSFEHSPGI
ncbi:uncharacterized protein MELLADRAFT_68193 [Melampsora larici-populina 98AG31]|uniref:Uncharacterized protein n=1 Tax=Melampsora larici-populina (strain 98AG31 / pathotype 3-4-7) TaxID=747676 RepID=F4S5X4_MELLP|nr:uncharacterized protein MELLADRAFT_68193 [Melampsora larici-populina 98AG31]EGF99977.1 hypothetical protein MELLADRAFT_68193 [Melampsora larici-populina 98AG31]